MPIVESQLRLIATFVDRASGGLHRMGSSLVDLARKGEAVNKFAKVAGPALLGVSAAGGALLYSSTRLAARVQTLGVVTQQLGKTAGYTADQINQFEKSIRAQGITLQATRSSMAMMMQAQIDLADGAKLARVAQDAAVIGNMNSSQAFETLTRAILTGRVALARTMGLQVQFGEAQNRMAKDLGVTVEELTEQQIVAARTNEVFRQAATIQGAYSAAMETTGKKILSLDRHIEESRRILGEAYLPMAADVVDTITNMLKGFEALHPAQQRQIAVGLGMGTAWAGVAGAGLAVVAILPQLAAGLKIVGIASTTALGPIGLLVVAIAAVTTSTVALNAKMKEENRLIGEVNKNAIKQNKTFDQYKKNVIAAAEGTTMWALAVRDSAMSGRDFEESLWAILVANEALTEAEYEHWLIAEANKKQRKEQIELMGRWRSLIIEAAGNVEELADATEDVKTEAEIATERLDAFWDAMGRGPGILSEIESMQEQVRYDELGAAAIADFIDSARQAAADEKITGDQVIDVTDIAETAQIAITAGIEGLNYWEVRQMIKDNLSLTPTEAAELARTITAGDFDVESFVEVQLEEANKQMEAWVKDHNRLYIKAIIDYGGGGGEVADDEGQFGAHGVVPPGYPKDSFLLGLSSGEEYDVAPSGQTTHDSRDQSRHITQYVTIGSEVEGMSFLDRLKREIQRT